MAATQNTQVVDLVNNYKAAVEKAAETRKANLDAKANVRTLRTTLETLVEYGVVPASVFDEEDAAENNEE